jgi:hypothetical protein
VSLLCCCAFVRSEHAASSAGSSASVALISKARAELVARGAEVRGGPGVVPGGSGAGPAIQAPSHWLGGNPTLLQTPGEGHGWASWDELPSISLRVSLKAPKAVPSGQCQCSPLAGFAQGLQSHAIRPRFATSKTRGCYPMRAPSRVICLPPTEVSEERDDGIESAALSLLRRMHLRLSVRGFQGARKAQSKLSRAHTAGGNTYTAKQHAEAPRLT